jgi:hypothetical protein
MKAVFLAVVVIAVMAGHDATPSKKGTHRDGGGTEQPVLACRTFDGGIQCITVFLSSDSGHPTIVQVPDGQLFTVMWNETRP